ncbi:hypothetical protein AVEN_158618-1 [Araneus ventricosus]|uniref:Uncharacterized protein n=1 Tax=Araneus ventricosus TaxID=182803 RepID=A0A4Y2I6D7_ARAVE|nr:hypothetical protein AVEN_158618-1 [Araneus ventricosus]
MGPIIYDLPVLISRFEAKPRLFWDFSNNLEPSSDDKDTPELVLACPNFHSTPVGESLILDVRFHSSHIDVGPTFTADLWLVARPRSTRAETKTLPPDMSHN